MSSRQRRSRRWRRSGCCYAESRQAASIIAIAAPLNSLVARSLVVVGASDAGAADPAHRCHALGLGGVIATHRARAVLAAVDRAPWVVVGGLGKARRGCGKKHGHDEGSLKRAHGVSPGAGPLPPARTPRRRR